MKRLLGIVLGCVALGCGSPSTATSPSPLPQVNGTYVFVVQASATCTHLPITRFVWDVTATFANNSSVYVVHFPLPAPLPTLQGTLTYNTNILNPAIVAGSLSTPVAFLTNGPGVPIRGSTFKFNTNSSLAGTVAADTTGKAVITNGTLIGDIEILDSSNNLVADCAAVDHIWTLT